MKHLNKFLFMILFVTLPLSGWPVTKQLSTLSEVPQKIAEKYQVFFTYDSEELNQIDVLFEFKDDESLNSAIIRLLASTNYVYESFGSRYYVIYEKTRAGKKKANKMRHHLRELWRLEQDGVNLNRANNPSQRFNQIIEKVSSTYEELSISGKVTDENDNPLPGVSVLVKGTTLGTTTNTEGYFELEVPDTESIIVFSFVGYLSQEILIGGNQTSFGIRMSPDTKQLDELVVTALGLERQKKALGYATQQVEGDEIVATREPNLVSSLSGKIAGAQITNTSGAVGATSTIILRGYKSISGNNQPLFVVDGVPISNQTHQSSRAFEAQASNNSGYWQDQQVDYGNAAAEINPSDIESVQVLKGANAAALYGARAANGVVFITMKSGKGQTGLGIDINSSVSFQTPLKTPKFQTEFGKGKDGLYSFPDINANGGLSFGPKFDGQIISQYDPANPSTPRMIPWVNRLGSDPVRDFLETGITQNHGFSVTNGNDKGNFRLSYNWMDQKGMVPNTDLTRNNLGFNASYSPSSKMTFSANVNYVNSKSDNRPQIGRRNENNIMQELLKLGGQQSLDELKNYWEPFKEDIQQATPDNLVNNPYFILNENLNGNKRDRFFGNVTFSYDILEKLSMRVRVGTDFYNDRRTYRKAFSNIELRGGTQFINGTFRMENIVYQEDNTDILFTYKTDLGANFSMTINGGGNRMTQNVEEFRANVEDGLVVPGLYNLSNSRSALSAENFVSNKKINSVFGSAQLGYRDYIFLDISARNDWSSALPINNNSYFYPSISMSAIVSDIFDLGLNSSNDMIKVRASYAQVGNDTGPYQTGRVTIGGGTIQGISVNSIKGTLGNANLKPEEIESYEVGIEAGLFKNRLNFDATYYSITNVNQITNIQLPAETGYLERVINIPAEIRNQGVELALNLGIVETNNFNWSFGINWAKNNNKVTNFSDDPNERLTIVERFINLDITEGGSYGDIYGDYLLKVDANGKLGQEGEQIFRPDGRSEESDDVGSLVNDPKPYLGSVIPDWIGGVRNTFAFKQLSLYILFDINSGGKMYSRTFVRGNQLGALQESVELITRDSQEARDAAIANGHNVLPGEQWVILEGATLDRSTGQTETGKTIIARTENFYLRHYDNDLTGTFDRSFVKLRELRLTYQLSPILLAKLPFKGASVSFIGRNLFLWDKVPHVDPESAGFSGEIPGGEFYALPSAKSFGFNINLKF
ncbi:MAG: SusC/RagA family TonB-linked outer membrane protein [Cyclobacteriaceae bacterium]|nr:MAG: SusC/RagA family TonB-linked outer membrane protein [Cyclobacteriaceae bacterium]